MAVREMLISSAALIAVIALLRPLLRGRVPAGLQYALWLPVLLRLALPIRMLPSPASVSGAVERAAEAALPAVEAAVPARPDLWPWLWAAGSACVGLWFLVVNGTLAARLRRTRRLLGRRAGVPVYAAAVASPCLYGLLRPAVYLSERAAEGPEAELVIAHELTHRRHGDHVWALVRLLCLTAYWFDPFVWLAASLSRRDGEIFCDAATVRTLGEDRRFDYGRALLSLAAPAGWRAMFSGASTMSAGGRRLRERIGLIAGGRRASVLIAGATVLAMAAAVGCAFSGPAEIPAPMATSAPWTTPEPAAQGPAVLPDGREPEITPVPTPTPDPAVRTAAEPLPVRGTEQAVRTASQSADVPAEARTYTPAQTAEPARSYPVTAAPEPTPTVSPEPTPTPPSTVPYTPGPGSRLTYTDENGASYTVVVTAVPEPTPTPPPSGGGSGSALYQLAEAAFGTAPPEITPEPAPTPVPAEGSAGGSSAAVNLDARATAAPVPVMASPTPDPLPAP